MTIRQELLDELLKDYKNPEDLLGRGGLMDQLKKRLIETVYDDAFPPLHSLGNPYKNPLENKK